jgi:cytochrome oxidase assembly protein ShyY1
MTEKDIVSLREGAIFTGFVTGCIAYQQYRNFISKEFYRSEAHYRFSSRITNCTPWKQLYFTWWRMPEEEWTVYHRFKPYFLFGQLDMSKEVLIPRKRTINGNE